MTRGFTVWFTGLPSAGKSTLSCLLAERLRTSGVRVEVLDGDVVRLHISQDLQYSKKDRDDNVRRIGYICELLSRNGVVVVAALVSPYRAARERIRFQIRDFVEVYVECPLAELIARDVKGLYKRALAGEIKQFSGISDAYEPPLAPEVTIHSAEETPEQALDKIWQALEEMQLVSSKLSRRYG